MWQAIETAPSGETVLVFSQEYGVDAAMKDSSTGLWWVIEEYTVSGLTHWMPYQIHQR